MHFVHIHRNILILIAFNRLTYCYFFIQVILFSTCNYNSVKLNSICSSCSTFNNLGESVGMMYRQELYLTDKNTFRTITPLHLQKTIKSIRQQGNKQGRRAALHCSPSSLCLKLPGAGAAPAFMKAKYPALEQNTRDLPKPQICHSKYLPICAIKLMF